MRRRLESVPIPGEDAAEERALRVLRAAYVERLPAPAPPRRRARLLAFPVAAAAVLALAVSPAGPSLLHSVRAAVGLRGAAPALVRLPTAGRLLVDSGAGPWIVSADGSKRLLGRYAAASWSPRGLFEAAVRGHELAALDPRGNVRWSLERGGAVHDPAWSPDGYRIAYLDGTSLRVVAGDGTGDHLLARGVAAVIPAWRPVARHVLAYVTSHGVVHVVDADTGRELARWRAPSFPRRIAFASDGRYLLVLGRTTIDVRTAALRRILALRTHSTIVDGAWAPRGDRYAVVGYDVAANRSSVVIQTVEAGSARTLFVGTGRIDGLAWAPDGHWVVLPWRSADQWLFARAAGPRRLRAVASISAQFHSRSFPEPADWCC